MKLSFTHLYGKCNVVKIQPNFILNLNNLTLLCQNHLKNTELRNLRNKEIYKAYKKALRVKSFSTIRDVCVYLAENATAPKYYIEASTASILFGKLAKGDTLDNLSEGCRRRIFDLVDKYYNYRQTHDCQNMSRLRVLEIIIEQPAPEFYLSVARIRGIILEELKKERGQTL